MDYDGEILEGFLDDDGNLVLDGDAVFVRVEDISYYPSEDSEPARFDMTDTAWDAEGIIYNFYSDGTVVMSDFEFSDEGTYTVDGDYILMEFEGQFPYEAYYDSSDDSFQVDGLDGWFYYVDEAWYTP